MPQSNTRNTLQEARIKIEEDGGLVIPAQFCSALGIEAGDEIILRWDDDELRITKRVQGERARRGGRRARR
jgi:bifunctional DNA-binding transcriptional regulator/antitoxin component of YhaV-PrlF toxin-antitoxin module